MPADALGAGARAPAQARSARCRNWLKALAGSWFVLKDGQVLVGFRAQWPSLILGVTSLEIFNPELKAAHWHIKNRKFKPHG